MKTFYNRISMFAAALMVSVVSLAQDAEINGVCYNLNRATQEASVTSKNADDYSEVVTIPSTITHNDTVYTVTGIGNYAFSDCKALTSVTLPSSLKKIGTYAFSDCESLTAVVIPDNVTDIEESAFYRCTGIKSIVIPDLVKTVGTSAFSCCSNLSSVVIGKSVTTLGYGVFHGVQALLQLLFLIM